MVNTSNILSGFGKQAEKQGPSYWEKQRGTLRAMADKNLSGYVGIKNSELLGDELKRGLAHGAVGGASGAGLGALASLLSKGKVNPGIGAALGGLLGLSVGGTHGQYKAQKDYLKRKGINLKYLGLNSDFSPRAQKKYIEPYRKK